VDLPVLDITPFRLRRCAGGRTWDWTVATLLRASPEWQERLEGLLDAWASSPTRSYCGSLVRGDGVQPPASMPSASSRIALFLARCASS